jgi:ABC-type sugar transport system permease subunit
MTEITTVDPLSRKALAPTRSTGGVNEQWLARWMIAPAVIVMAVVVLIPLIYALFLSLSHAEVRVVAGQGGVVSQFAGLDNYLYFIKDRAFWASIRVTLYFTIVSLTLEVVIGIGIALVLNEEFPGRAVVRSLLILPWAVPTVVNARLWSLILEPHPYGALNGLLAALHLQGSGDAVNFLTPVPVFQGVPILGDISAWLGATQAIHWIIVADSWKVIPVIALLTLGGLQAIPKEQYEAAEVDGASALQRFWAITFPGLRPVLLVILVYRTMELFRVFDILYILMAYTIPVVAIRTFQETFVFGLFGRGSALAFLIALIILGLSVLYRRFIQVED